MAIPWLSVLKLVPWGDVISNAPVVADGAKKLWNAVGKKASPTAAASGIAMPGAPPSQTVTLQTLQAQLGETQSALASLHQQMVSSSELIQALADQNAQLIVRIEVLRKRLAWLAWGLAAMAVVIAGLWIAKAA
jgi:hypothetical protein